MKRYLLLLLTLPVLSTIVYAQTKINDTIQVDTLSALNFTPAEQAVKNKDYKKACDLYIELKNQADSMYADINSQKVEDLRREYSIDEVQLQEKLQQNRFLSLAEVAGACILVVFIVSFYFVRRQNKRLAISREELKQATALAETSIRNKSLFLSNMSHEIKTPLNALAGFAEVLTMPEVDDNTREQCNDIIQLNSELLLKLLNDVIDISCLDIANMQFSIKPCEAVALCQNVVKTVCTIKQTDAKVLFETDLPELELDTDIDRLQQLLINLLVNASKFTKEGSIILKLEKLEEDRAQFSVTDTGCGIPLENQPNIFKRFEKLNEKAQGTGLGLSICQLIIKRLGGEIWIDPTYTEGARFVFVHPIKQEAKV